MPYFNIICMEDISHHFLLTLCKPKILLQLADVKMNVLLDSATMVVAMMAWWYGGLMVASSYKDGWDGGLIVDLVASDSGWTFFKNFGSILVSCTKWVFLHCYL